MSRRLIRLYNEHQEILQAFTNHSFIFIRSTFGNPPEKYQIEYRIKGIEQKGNTIVEKNNHLCEITLSSGYPREMPICRPLTPVFHPNISPSVICIADQWAAGESLTDIIVRIGEMICYQNYNIKSPRNGEAARWAEKNTAKFPLDSANLSIVRQTEETPIKSEEEIQKSIEERQKDKKEKTEITGCENCGVKGDNIQFYKCANEHLICSDCTVECQTCGRLLCILCPLNKCSVCGIIICSACLTTCPLCNKIACRSHLIKCSTCGCEVCTRCIKGDFSSDHSSANKCLCVDCASKVEKKTKITYEDLKNNKVGDLITQKAQSKTAEKSISVRHCPKCGYTILDVDANFCETCGYNLIKSERINITPKRNPSSSRTFFSTFRIIVTLISIVAVIAIFVGLALFIKSNTTDIKDYQVSKKTLVSEKPIEILTPAQEATNNAPVPKAPEVAPRNQPSLPQVVTSTPKPPPVPDTLETVRRNIKLGNEIIDGENPDYNKAIEIFKRVIDLDPDNKDAIKGKEKAKRNRAIAKRKGQSLLSTKKIETHKGYIYVTSVPVDASIFINGHYKAKTPTEINLATGDYSMALIKEDYEIASIQLNIKEGKNLPLSIRLNPK